MIEEEMLITIGQAMKHTEARENVLKHFTLQKHKEKYLQVFFS